MSNKSLNRQSLKSLFSDGKRPNANNFGSLIDSVINKADDGISKNFKDGLTLAPEGTLAPDGEKATRIISFKEKIQDRLPAWGLELTQNETQGLGFTEPISEKESKTRLFFEKGGNIGVGTTKPRTSLEVNGILGVNSRIGTYKFGTIPADRKWHPIITDLNGCCAFEVMAQVGKEKTGRYALLHAHALSTFGKSFHRIRRTQAHYGWWWNKLSIKWIGNTNNYSLVLRTRSDYGSDQEIKFYITKLWDNEILSLFNQK